VAGDEVEERVGDELRKRWERFFDELPPEVEAFDGAYDVIAALRARGHPIVLASSAIRSHSDAFVDDKLRARELADGWTTKDDVEASKPDPDLVAAAWTHRSCSEPPRAAMSTCTTGVATTGHRQSGPRPRTPDALRDAAHLRELRDRREHPHL
jgi:hypothetical protein